MVWVRDLFGAPCSSSASQVSFVTKFRNHKRKGSLVPGSLLLSNLDSVEGLWNQICILDQKSGRCCLPFAFCTRRAAASSTCRAPWQSSLLFWLQDLLPIPSPLCIPFRPCISSHTLLISYFDHQPALAMYSLRNSSRVSRSCRFHHIDALA